MEAVFSAKAGVSFIRVVVLRIYLASSLPLACLNFPWMWYVFLAVTTTTHWNVEWMLVTNGYKFHSLASRVSGAPNSCQRHQRENYENYALWMAAGTQPLRPIFRGRDRPVT